MDKEIYNRYIELKPPFDGKVMFIKEKMLLDDLRNLVKIMIRFLRENQLLNNMVYRVWDWFEHDGYMPAKEEITEEFLTEFTKNNDVFYQNRSGDAYVKLGLYDELSRWYLRIYIKDEYDLESGEELGGILDITANEELLWTLYKYLNNMGFEKIQLEDTRKYFGQRYAGTNKD